MMTLHLVQVIVWPVFSVISWNVSVPVRWNHFLPLESRPRLTRCYHLSFPFLWYFPLGVLLLCQYCPRLLAQWCLDIQLWYNDLNDARLPYLPPLLLLGVTKITFSGSDHRG